MTDITSGWPPMPPHLEADVREALKRPYVQLVLVVFALGEGEYGPVLLLPDSRSLCPNSYTALREVATRCGVSDVQALIALTHAVTTSIVSLERAAKSGERKITSVITSLKHISCINALPVHPGEEN
jgi:hypothetical protein